jgi:hypothetical protein
MKAFVLIVTMMSLAPAAKAGSIGEDFRQEKIKEAQVLLTALKSKARTVEAVVFNEKQLKAASVADRGLIRAYRVKTAEELKKLASRYENMIGSYAYLSNMPKISDFRDISRVVERVKSVQSAFTPRALQARKVLDFSVEALPEFAVSRAHVKHARRITALAYDKLRSAVVGSRALSFVILGGPAAGLYALSDSSSPAVFNGSGESKGGESVVGARVVAPADSNLGI